MIAIIEARTNEAKDHAPFRQSHVCDFLKVSLKAIGMGVLYCNRSALQGFVNLFFDGGTYIFSTFCTSAFEKEATSGGAQGVSEIF